MRVPRMQVTTAAALTFVVVIGGACAYALGLPPSTSGTPPAAAAAPRTASAATGSQDGRRPAIEAVADRDSALALLPRDNAGNVDWIAAVQNGTIRPRAAAPGRDSAATTVFGFDTYLRSKPGTFEAYFPHSSHTLWLGCQNCHPRVFRTTGDTLSMAAINAGEQCGQCHGKVAFAPTTCERCHEALQMAAGRVTATLRDDRALTRLPGAVAAGRTQSYAPASFSHAVHRIRYRCSACHETLFAMQAGAGSMQMADMDNGRGCGACHNGTAAFALVRCARCHVAGSSSPGP